MPHGGFRKPVGSLLVFLLLLFGLVQGAEIFHSLEEGRHLPHHAHHGTAYHDPLPCDSAQQDSDFCAHSQPSTTALQHWQNFGSVALESASWDRVDVVTVLESSLRAIRAPPTFS